MTCIDNTLEREHIIFPLVFHYVYIRQYSFKKLIDTKPLFERYDIIPARVPHNFHLPRLSICLLQIAGELILARFMVFPYRGDGFFFPKNINVFEQFCQFVRRCRRMIQRVIISALDVFRYFAYIMGESHYEGLRYRQFVIGVIFLQDTYKISGNAVCMFLQ